LNQNKQNTAPGVRDQEQASAFFHAVELVLRPICRMLVRRGFTIHNVVELVKRAFLAGAADVIKEQGFPVTEKRLSIYTSLSLTEVSRLRGDLAASVDLSETKLAKVTRLFTAWHLDPRFTIQFVDTPRALAVTEREGLPSFQGLVEEFATGLDYKQLLEELCRLGAVSIQQETGLVHLNARAYIPEPYDRTDSERFGRMLSAYAVTIELNSRKKAPGLGRFDRYVCADFAVSAEDEAAFHQLVREDGQKMLEKFDGWLAARPRVAENGRRPGVAIFFAVETDVSQDSRPVVVEDTGRANESDTTNSTAKESGSDDDANVIDTLTFRLRGK
jgi:Family of unknown function (DUF6502)